MSAHSLRRFVLGIVDGLQKAAYPQRIWSSREDGIVMVEEILLEARACGFETKEGIEELCRAVIQLQLKLPFPKQVCQALSRPGLNEIQRVESLHLAHMENHRDAALAALPALSRN